MNTLELAKLLGRRHANVQTGVFRLAVRLGEELIEDSYETEANQRHRVYRMSDRLALNYLLGISPIVRAHYIEKLDAQAELEEFGEELASEHNRKVA